MSMAPIWKVCPMCNKKYSWNPDVGKLVCPHCSKLDDKSETLWDKMFKKKEDNKYLKR